MDEEKLVIAPAKKTDITTGKIVVNGVEVTDIESWNKAVSTFSKLEMELKEKDKEIEGLHQGIEIKNKVIQEEKRLKQRYIEGYNYLKKEIERLQNIIDELEKDLIEMSDRSWDDNGAYDDVLDKLKELKEGNKDE